jgi:hypothetical protein
MIRGQGCSKEKDKDNIIRLPNTWIDIDEMQELMLLTQLSNVITTTIYWMQIANEFWLTNSWLSLGF